MKRWMFVLASVVTVAAATCIAAAQEPRGEKGKPDDPPGKEDRPGRDDRRADRAAQRAPAKSGVVTEFNENPNGDTDGLRLDDGTEVRFPASASKKLVSVISLKDRVTIEGWTQPGESEIHAATIKHEASGKVVVVDRPPPEISQGPQRPRGGGPEDEADDRPPPPRPKEGGPGPRPKPEPGERRPPKPDQGRQYSLEQAVSDQAQLHTIAFDGLAFLTGDFGGDTFLPPGKVSDYFGFQYMRDIDAREGGHNTSFLTRIRNTDFLFGVR